MPSSKKFKDSYLSAFYAAVTVVLLLFGLPYWALLTGIAALGFACWHGPLDAPRFALYGCYPAGFFAIGLLIYKGLGF